MRLPQEICDAVLTSWEITRVATNTIIAALRYGQLLNLTELEVTLPTAPEFGQLFGNEVGTLGTPIEDTLEGLRHLGLHVDGENNPYTRSDQTDAVKLVEYLTALTIEKEAVGFLKILYTILTMVGPVRSKRRAQRSTTTYGYRRALKDIRQPGKRATLEDKKAYKKLLEELRQREDDLVRAKPAKKNGKNDPAKDEEYEVERVLDSRVNNGELKFYVLWKGFSMEEVTWEPRSNLDNSTEAIDEYFRAHPSNPGGPLSPNRPGRPSLNANEKAT
ncbi:hypothetical protein V502_04903 [Pseudogymnoascus sp. VKM F-4520 (FW-2644)]|nr:hypothetical protein V502_04903 [Pseudogymnoascus sp. VKM F-4520 (FW-2644)]